MNKIGWFSTDTITCYYKRFKYFYYIKFKFNTRKHFNILNFPIYAGLEQYFNMSIKQLQNEARAHYTISCGLIVVIIAH